MELDLIPLIWFQPLKEAEIIIQFPGDFELMTN